MLGSLCPLGRLDASSALGRVIVADGDDAGYATVRRLAAPDLWQVRYAADAPALRHELRSNGVLLAVVNLALIDDEIGEELIDRAGRGLRIVVLADEHSEDNERRARLLCPVAYAPRPEHLSTLRRVLADVLIAAGAGPKGGRT